MATINQFTRNMEIISALSDEPNDTDGLTAAQLKARFDEAGKLIKAYINESLIPDIESYVAAGVSSEQLAELIEQSIISVLQSNVLAIAYGGTGASTAAGARENIGITSGTSLPAGGNDGDIYFMYS